MANTHMGHPFLSSLPTLPSSSRMLRSTADTMIQKVEDDRERPDSPNKRCSNEKSGSQIGTQAEEGWMLVLCDGTKECDDFLASEQENDSAKSAEKLGGDMLGESLNDERKAPVGTKAMGGRMASRCDETNERKERFTSEQKNDDTDSDGDTEGWDGDVSGEGDDDESDTYEIQAKDSVEDEDGADDDGYEADDEAD